MKKALIGILLISSMFSQAQDEELKKLQKEQAAAMEPLAFLHGEWDVASYQPGEDGAWELKVEEAPPGPTVFEAAMEGKMITTHMPGSISYLGTFTYDVFNDQYRAAFIDSSIGLLDTFTGRLENGVLTLSNVESNTFYTYESKTIHTRLQIEPSGPSGFAMIIHGSEDKGKAWTPMGKLVFAPKQHASK